MRIFFNFVLIISFITFLSCSKEEKQQSDKTVKKETKQEEQEQNPSDTLMSPEEKFSSSIVVDFLDSPEDEDLTDYLEEELFKYSQTYRGASVMQLSTTIWFVTLENKTSTQNFLLQKFVDFNSNDYYFVLKETNLNISDVIASASLYRSSNATKNKESQPSLNQTAK
jgi:hypothetical protein